MFRNSLLLLTSAFSCVEVRAQPEAPVTLNIEVANIVIYRSDVADATRFATEPGPTTPLPLRTFMPVTFIGDVVAVNGTPAKGNMTMRGTFLALDRNPAPGVGVADTINRLFGEWDFNIQRTDGSPVGSIMATGWAFGDRAAGVLGPGQGDLAVSGGTGAFLGVRGQGNETGTPAARRAASITEDPANRRIIGGNAWSYGFQLIPMARPAFATSGNSPMLFHADFTPVTAANPARKGEVLIAAVTGLGPTLPKTARRTIPCRRITGGRLAHPGAGERSCGELGKSGWLARHGRNISRGLSSAGGYRYRHGRHTASVHGFPVLLFKYRSGEEGSGAKKEADSM